ncbi:MAG: aminodeoxychorismate/anthranilate synthase component II [Calditrichaeota bacterium]|nr:MAG: aminodeoxychorismate/anthranilate synthase component II [Calditrichota bacterium]
MILVIDNYDSFTYNLVQYLGELGAKLDVYRNDKIGVSEVLLENPRGIIISPGPGRPEDAGVTVSLIQEAGPKIPILGVCLGHQAIGMAFGGEIILAPRLMHGKTSTIKHDGSTLFRNVSNPFVATRYHSLMVSRENLPDELNITAESEDGVIMGLKHRDYPIFGVQFHPESILTREGKIILKNFLDFCYTWDLSKN